MNFFKIRKFIKKPDNPEQILHKVLCNNKCLDSRFLYPTLPLFLQCTFIDPGTTSCGIRIVRYYLETQDMEIFVSSILNFGNNQEDINKNINLVFEPIKLYLQESHHIIIEHQFMKCILTYRCFSSIIYFLTNFICQYRIKPILFEVDVQLKTVFLGGPKTKKQNNSDEMKKWVALKNFKKTGIYKLPDNGTIEIKEWTKMKSEIICKNRKDYVTLHILENSLYKGNEDISDVICYEYAWINYLFRHKIFIPYQK